MTNKMILIKPKYLVNALLSFCSAIALCMNFHNYYVEDGMPGSLFECLHDSMSNLTVLSTILFVFFMCCSMFVDKYELRASIWMVLLNVCIALVWLMGSSFQIDNTSEALYSSPYQIFNDFLYVVGVTYILTLFSCIFKFFLEQRWDVEWKDNVLFQQYRKHPFRFICIVILICWLPHIIIAYPASMCWDTWFQIDQFFGLYNLAAHYPITNTVLVGLFVRMGMSMGSGNIGLFAYVIVQSLIYVLVLSYMLYTMKSVLKAPRWLRLLTFLTIIISPYYTSYINLVLNDMPYVISFLLFVTELVYVIHLKEKYWNDGKHCLLFFLAVGETMLMRNNGKYIIYCMAIILIVYMIYICKRKKRLDKIGQAVMPLLIVFYLKKVKESDKQEVAGI